MVLDAFHPVCFHRLADVSGTISDETQPATPTGVGKLLHFACPSLSHFIALLCRPSPSCIPAKTCLIVVDSLSALLNHALPRTPEARLNSRTT